MEMEPCATPAVPISQSKPDPKGAATFTGLPSPLSLPTAANAELETSNDVRQGQESRPASSDSSSDGSDQDNFEVLDAPFTIDESEPAAGEPRHTPWQPREAQTASVPPHAQREVTRPSAFSSNVVVRRPFRSRYNDDEDDTLLANHGHDPATEQRAEEAEVGSSFKRSYDQTATPPLDRQFVDTAISNSFSPLTANTVASARPSSNRHSFDSQRATVTNRMRYLREHDVAVSSLLRRRSPISSRASSRDSRADLSASIGSIGDQLDAPDDRFKRRRSARRSVSNEDVELLDPPSHSRSTAFAPALGRYPPQAATIDPVLSSTSEGRSAIADRATEDDVSAIRRARLVLPPARDATSHRGDTDEQYHASFTSPFPSLSTFRRATSTSFQVAAPAAFVGPSHTSSTTSFTASPLPSSSMSSLRPRPARSQPGEREVNSLASFWQAEDDQRRANEALDIRGREILDRASDRLTRALAASERTERLLEEQRQATARDDEARSARMLEQLPSPPALGGDGRIDDSRPVIGVRLGEGWSTRRTPRLRVDDLAAPTSPTSSHSESSSPRSPDGQHGSRAMHILQNLRTRRPRLSRDSTRVPPPEESPEAVMVMEESDGWPDIFNAHSLPPFAAESRRAERASFRSVLDNLRHQRQRSEPAQTAVGERSATEGATSSLWGQVGDSQAVAPLERPASLFSRRMRGPTERANERWRLGQAPSSSAVTTTTSATAEQVPPWRRREDDSFPSFHLTPRDERRPRRALPPALSNDASGETAPFTRDDSPSPRRVGEGIRRDQLRSRGAIDSDMSGDVYRGNESNERLAVRIDRPSVQPPLFTRSRLLSQHRARNPLAGEEEDDGGDGVPAPRFWRPPTLPPMLPSGSLGHRAGLDGGREPSDSSDRTIDTAARQITDRPRSLLTEAFARRTASASASTHAESSQNQQASSTLRRRRTIFDSLTPRDAVDSDPAAGMTAADRGRSERLATLRRERNIMRTLLDGSPLDEETPPLPMDARDDTAPRSPGGTRRRGLSDFFRGIGGVGGRFVAAWDDDFVSFFTRDSAALNPLNYVDDDEFDTSYDALIRLSERLGDAKPRGLTAEKLASLKRFKYSEWPYPQREAQAQSVPPVATTSAITMDEDVPAFARRSLEKEERCAVCLDEYEEDDECMLGRCQHGFHAACFQAWLKEHGTCPVCRQDHSE